MSNHYYPYDLRGVAGYCDDGFADELEEALVSDSHDPSSLYRYNQRSRGCIYLSRKSSKKKIPFIVAHAYKHHLQDAAVDPLLSRYSFAKVAAAAANIVCDCDDDLDVSGGLESLPTYVSQPGKEAMREHMRRLLQGTRYTPRAVPEDELTVLADIDNIVRSKTGRGCVRVAYHGTRDAPSVKADRLRTPLERGTYSYTPYIWTAVNESFAPTSVQR